MMIICPNQGGLNYLPVTKRIEKESRTQRHNKILCKTPFTLDLGAQSIAFGVYYPLSSSMHNKLHGNNNLEGFHFQHAHKGKMMERELKSSHVIIISSNFLLHTTHSLYRVKLKLTF